MRELDAEKNLDPNANVDPKYTDSETNPSPEQLEQEAAKDSAEATRANGQRYGQESS